MKTPVAQAFPKPNKNLTGKGERRLEGPVRRSGRVWEGSWAPSGEGIPSEPSLSASPLPPPGESLGDPLTKYTLGGVIWTGLMIRNPWFRIIFGRA